MLSEIDNHVRAVFCQFRQIASNSGPARHEAICLDSIAQFSLFLPGLDSLSGLEFDRSPLWLHHLDNDFTEGSKSDLTFQTRHSSNMGKLINLDIESGSYRNAGLRIPLL
jgi:hypothetical protein